MTRSDFDGLVCAVLLKELGMIDEIQFVHPRDMQEGKIEITGRDITTNLPYAEGVHLAFDHHMSETHRVAPHENLIIDAEAPSASRVLYRHFGGASRFPGITAEMLAAVDRADAGQLTREEIFSPKEWVLLHFLLDPRTGLDRFRNFNVSDPELMRMLTDYCRHHTVQEVMEHFDVAERASRYFVLEEPFKEQLQRCAAVRGPIVVIDLRGDDPIWAGNRFMHYALYPDCNISIHLTRVPGERRTELAVGKSIFDRSSRYHVGLEMLKYGGGDSKPPAPARCRTRRRTRHWKRSSARSRPLGDGGPAPFPKNSRKKQPPNREIARVRPKKRGGFASPPPADCRPSTPPPPWPFRFSRPSRSSPAPSPGTG